MSDNAAAVVVLYRVPGDQAVIEGIPTCHVFQADRRSCLAQLRSLPGPGPAGRATLIIRSSGRPTPTCTRSLLAYFFLSLIFFWLQC